MTDTDIVPTERDMEMAKDIRMELMRIAFTEENGFLALPAGHLHLMATYIARARLDGRREGMGMAPIETVPKSGLVIMYFPAGETRLRGFQNNPEMYRIGRPSDYPFRPPTLWAPLPRPSVTESDPASLDAEEAP